MRVSRRSSWIALAGSLLIVACSSMPSADNAVEVSDRSASDGVIGDTVEPVDDQTATTTSEPGPVLRSDDPTGDTDALDDDVAAAAPGGVTLDAPYVGDFGNTGYDVAACELTLDGDADELRLEGATTSEATATQDLPAFDTE
ncbi:MAG: hypothetical protein AB8G26_13410, partial [Ilumatobacter sp.]